MYVGCFFLKNTFIYIYIYTTYNIQVLSIQTYSIVSIYIYVYTHLYIIITFAIHQISRTCRATDGHASSFLFIYYIVTAPRSRWSITWMDVPGGVSLSSDLSFNPVPRDLAIDIPLKWFRQYRLGTYLYILYQALYTSGVMRSETETYQLHCSRV